MRKNLSRWPFLGLCVLCIFSQVYAQGTLTNVAVTPSDSTAGQATIYTISFAPDALGSGLPADGRISLTFPAGFDLQNVEIAANIAGLDGGYSTIQISGQIVLLTRDNTGTALGPGTAATLKIATVGNTVAAADTFRVTLETQDNLGTRIDGPTISPVFPILPAPATRVKILTGTSGNTAAYLATTYTTGDQDTLHAASFDIHGNYIQDENVNWNVSGGIGSLTPGAGISTVFTAISPGTGQITAAHATLENAVSGIITVNAGALFAVKIVEGPFGDGAELTARSLTADQSLTLHAAGYDSAGNYLGDQVVTWTSSGLTPALNTSASSVTFNPTAAPATGTIIATHATANGDVTGTISVSQGADHHVKILSTAAGNTPEVGNAGLTTGGNLTLHAGKFDADDNYIDDVSVTWILSGGIGTVFPSGASATIFTATTAGSGQITADHPTLLDDATGTITVSPGALAFVKIVEGPAGDGPELAAKALSADQTLTVHAAGYDASGNYLGDQTVTWARTGNLTPVINDVGPSITFSPTVAPALGTITASHATATGDATGDITVSTGAPHHIKVMSNAGGNTGETGASGMTTGQKLTVHASSFDADDNYINDVSVTWGVSGGIGSLSTALGIATEFTATAPGSGQIFAEDASLLDDATGVITVVSGTVASIRIVEGLSGDGPALGNRNLTADDILFVHAAGYDAQGNYVGDQNVTWGSTGTLAPPLSGTSTSLSFNPTTAPASGTITANHPTATDDVTGTIDVAVGAPEFVKVLSNASGNTSEVTTAGLTTGGTLIVHAASFDADDNYIQDVAVDWNLSGGIGTLFPASGATSTFTATTTGTGQITANHATLFDDATGTITVSAGNLAFVKIVEGTSGNGPELGTKTFTADQTLTVHAAGYDANGNYIGDQNVTWGSTGDLAPAINASGSSFTFNPTAAPASGTITASHATAADDATGTITISAGAPHHIKILSDPSGSTSEVGASGLTTGGTLTVHAASFDADDNYITDVSVDWTITGGIGTLNPLTGISTSFLATTPGSGQISAHHATLFDDATGPITVNSGSLSYVKIVEGPGGDGPALNTKTITADQLLTVHAAGYDASDNYLGDQTVTWGSTGTLAPVLSGSGTSITFSPTTAPASGTLTANHSTATDGATGLITVTVGAANHVKILDAQNGNTAEISTVGLTTGNTLTIHAASFDADENYVTDISVDWSVTGGIGTLSPTSGISTQFAATTPGSGVISASHASLIDDATGPITVNSGTLSYVRIVEGPSGDGPELGTRNITADEALTLHAAGYDASGNYLGDQSVNWTSTGTLAPAVTSSGPGFTFAPTTAPASGTIAVSHPSATGDATGTISVSVGAANAVKVLSTASGNTAEVGISGLTTGGTLTVHAASFDADGNYIQDESVDWTLSGGIGTLFPASGISTVFTATRPGTGQITATHATLIDDATGTITVSAGTLAFVRIVEGPSGDGPEVQARTLTADETITLHAAGYDINGNYLGDQTVNWSSIGTLAPALTGNSPAITFIPTTAPASGNIIADHASATDDTTGQITITTGAPYRLKILAGASGDTTEVGDENLATGGTLKVHAGQFDADDNYIADISVSWSVTGGIGTLAPASGISSLLTATTPGTGQISATHPALIADATGTITVATSGLAYVKIVEGPSGDGPELATRTLTADEVLTVHAAGYDASGNYLGDQSVSWSSTGSLAPALAGAGSSITFSPVTAPATGTLVADHPTATDDETGTISVSAGAAQHLKVLSGASGNTSEVTTAGLTTGGTLTVHASSFDADDNYIGDVPVNWEITGGIGSLSDPSGVTTSLTATTPGSGAIFARHATLIDDATGAITVTAGTLAYVIIVEGPAGDGAELAAKSLTADQILTVHAAGYDANDNYLGDQTVAWTSTGGLSPVVSGNGPSITFSPVTAPASGTLIADHATAADDTTGTISISVGTAQRIHILSDASGNTGEVTTAGLVTGTTMTVHAGSFDADGNYITDVNVDWSVSGGIGTLAPTTNASSTTLTATTAGSGVITANHPTLIDDATGTITVSSGTLAFVRIVEGPSGDGPALGAKTLTADQTLTVHAAGYDANNNYLGDQTVTWSSTGTLAPTLSGNSSSISFNPVAAPATGTLVATHATATGDETGTISVTVGLERYVSVLAGANGNTPEVGNVNLTTGQTLTVHASSFDADNNYVQDVSVSWLLAGSIGALAPASGITTTLTATTAGTGVITADHATIIDDATGSITVSAGQLSYVKVVEGPSGDGPELGARSLTTDDVLTVHAAGYDSNDNYIGDQAVNWSVSGGIGTLNPLFGTSTVLRLTTPGAGRILADHDTALDDSSGVLTVGGGALHLVKVLAGASGNTPPLTGTAITTDDVIIVHAGGFDINDNYLTDVSVNWSVSGNIGTVNPATGVSTTLSANRVGNGQITADHATATDGQSGIISVSPGALAFIQIIEGPSGDGLALGDRTLTADHTLTLHAAGFDADSNYVGDQSVAWSSTGTLAPAVSGTGTSVLFSPTVAPATGTISATHATAGSDETGTITVNVGTLHHVSVLSGGAGETSPVGATSMNPGEQLVVHAGGFDADNNYIADQIVNWSVIGPIGSIAPASGLSATFSAHTVGTGSIRADASGSILDASSGTITVGTGSVAKILIRNAPANGGAEFGTFKLTTDEEVTFYAAGYDAGDNYFGDVSVTWSSTGNLAPAANATGSSFTFSPVTGSPTGGVTGTIIAVHSPGVSDTTGTITVRPGEPVGDILLTATPTLLPADGSSTAQVISSAIRDAEGNNVGHNRLFTVTVTPSTLGSILTADASTTTPGHQIATDRNSLLSFTFQAGTTGGIATINATGGIAASGNTQISLGSLTILSISTTPDFVSQGQTGIPVTMTIRNLAPSDITNLQGVLTFTGSSDRTGEYTVQPSGSNPTTVNGNSTITLSFLVDVSSGATLEAITIDGTISGQLGAAQVTSSTAGTVDSWTVQRPAAVLLQSVSSAPDTVSQGQRNLTVTVRASNNLGAGNAANAVVDSIRLVFRQGPVDKTADYVIAPNPANPTLISGNSSADFSFSVNVGLSATPGPTLIDAEIFARDANSNAPLSDPGASTTDSWVVVEGNAFSIVSITPSQPAVTEGMLKPWQIRMLLQNTGSSGITVDLAPQVTNLKLVIGNTDVTSEYTIQPPAAFDEGGTLLGPGATGTLTFPVTKAGTTTGIVTIAGFAAGQDNATGLPISDNTNDSGSGAVRVQTPGTLSITSLQVSQPSVTAGRGFDWAITATVTNAGESDVRLAPSPATVTVGDNAGYSFITPAGFTDGDSILAGGETKSFEITVDQTGSQLGTLPVSLVLDGTEINSSRAVQSNAGGATVLGQTPAALAIRAVRPSQPSVTAGQTTPWTVTVAVENTGQSDVRLQAGASTLLRFRLNNIFQTDYTASLQDTTWLGSKAARLAGGTTDSVRFVITQTGTNSGAAALWPQISTAEINSQTAVQAADNGSSSVQVQQPALLSYLTNSLLPDVVNNNGFYAFKARVRNAGQATVELQPALTTFEFSDGAVNVVAALDANKVVSLPPGDTTLTFQQVQIPANMQQARYTPVLKIRGTVNGSAFSRDLSVTTDELQVTAPAEVQIISLRPSQPRVTRSMEKNWFIIMGVRNNGGTGVVLDSVALVLFNGGNVTSEFTIIEPATFLGSGTTVLAAGTSDSLRFEVQRTGIRQGPTTIQGRLWVIDQASQQRIFTQTDSGGGSFVVQGPASLEIVQVIPSQPAATQNQTTPWNVDVKLRNAGESDLALLFDPDSSGIVFSRNAGNDYVVSYPSTLLDGSTLLTGGSEKILRFIVIRTGAQTGTNLISAAVRAVEVNSDVRYAATVPAGSEGAIEIQAPARLRVKSAAFAGAPNLPKVNTSQTFQLLAAIENFGQETADSVVVRLVSDGTSSISPTTQMLSRSLTGSQVDTARFTLTAAAAGDPAETFTATIISAKARNTGLSATLEPPVNNRATAVIQPPAVLRITKIVPSQSDVAAEQNNPWQIFVLVKNDGTASLRLNPPKREDIQFKIGSNVQNDYTVVAPAGLAQAGSLVLVGGAADTLKYTVTNTGRLGGTVDIVGAIGAIDLNSTQALTAENAGSVLVKSTAAVRILRTELIVKNRLGTSDIGLVNVGQPFSVRVVVENSGLEGVENVRLQLSTDGNSAMADSIGTIGSIPARQTRELLFSVVAASLPTAGASTETFTAVILSATASQSQEPAAIFLPADETARVQIQRAAALSLGASLDDADNILSTNQLFEVTALVSNNGQAETGTSGRLTIELPPDFALVEPGPAAFEQPFQAGQPTVWKVRAPQQTVDAATLRVLISRIPKDLNADATAQVVNDSTQLSIKVVRFDLAVTKFFFSAPPGAADNILSTTQSFSVTANIAFSEDLAGRPHSVTLNPPPGYTLLSPQTIDDFAEISTWNLLAPQDPHGERLFTVVAEGVSGTGTRLQSADTLRVTLVSRALLALNLSITEPPGAQDNTVSTGQTFTVRATLANRGTAGVLGAGLVRLELGQSGFTTADTLEKAISTEETGFAEWRVTAPQTQIAGEITVRLLQRPLDENSGLDASVTRETSALMVSTVETGALAVNRFKIVSPLGAVDGTLSTDQPFTVSADLQWSNIRNITARLVLPSGFFTEDEFRNFSALNGPASASWIVRAPEIPVAAQELRIQLEGDDANNDTLRLKTRSGPLQIDIIEKAVARLNGFISAPPSAIDGIVSLNQVFEVTGEILNLGQANFVGGDSVRIALPEGYSTTEPLSKASVGGRLIWQVKAREQQSASIENIKLSLIKRPKDENSGVPVAIENSDVLIPIQTEPRQLQVVSLPLERIGPSTAGQQNVTLFSLSLLNLGNAGSSDILLRGLTVFVEDRFGEEIAPNTALKQVRVTAHQRPDVLYGEVAQMPPTNPVTVAFAAFDTLAGGVPDTIDIVVDIADTPQASDFQLAVVSGEAIDAIDADSKDRVEIQDERGLAGLDFSLVSAASALTAADYKEFFNYPNPFRPGRDGDAGTFFNYFLPNDSDVEFKILTLAGELVYKKTFAASSPQGRAGARRNSSRIFWDGFNGRGEMVLNGVYVAVLKTSAGVVTTKVAVAK